MKIYVLKNLLYFYIFAYFKSNQCILNLLNHNKFSMFKVSLGFNSIRFYCEFIHAVSQLRFAHRTQGHNSMAHFESILKPSKHKVPNLQVVGQNVTKTVPLKLKIWNRTSEGINSQLSALKMNGKFLVFLEIDNNANATRGHSTQNPDTPMLTMQIIPK